jgi:predicted glycosyltransferase
MRIWFDLTNSPHINMFAAMIRDLEGQHEIFITCRDLANTVALLDLHGFTYNVVGKHYGGRITAKLCGYPVRVAQLCGYLRSKRIDVAISQSSFHSPMASRFMGVRCIYMNDNEHALGNLPSFMCADKIMIPEYLAVEKVRKYGMNPRKVVHYPGVKEGIYLWELDVRLRSRQSSSRPERSRKVVYVRPEPWTAQYYTGARAFLDDLLLGMAREMDVVLLPRGAAQALHYQTERFACIRVVAGALDITEIVPDCDLFIGAGGTMTREMAVLGVPTISVYQDKLLDVDQFLIDAAAFVHSPALTASEAIKFMESAQRRPPNDELLAKGKAAYDMVKAAILSG